MRWLVLGSAGQLGQAFMAALHARNSHVTGLDFPAVDITDWSSVCAVVHSEKPDVIINCAAYNLVDQAETDRELAYRVNTLGPNYLAQAARQAHARLVHYSSDYVFDGQAKTPYQESDRPNPLNHYGASKWLGEQFVRHTAPDSLVFRVSWLYGRGTQNFIYKFRSWIRDRDTLSISEDEISVPTSVNLVVSGTLKALDAALSGIYHLVPSGYASRLEFARAVLAHEQARVTLNPVQMASFNLPAARPQFSALSNAALRSLGFDLPGWEQDLADYMKILDRVQ